MNDLHCLYTNGTDVFRIEKYVPPTDSIQGYFILARNGKGCEVALKDFLKDWKVFNSDAAFADYLLYIDKVLTDCRDTDFHNTIKHMMQWVKNRSTDAGITWSTPIKLEDLEIYGVDINEYLLEINKRILGDKT